MKRVFSLLAGCAVLLSMVPLRGQEGRTQVRKEGLFSYVAPPGWMVLTIAKINNPVATDPVEESHPYIEVNEVASTTAFAEFVAGNKASLKTLVPSAEIVDERPFVTTAGMKGLRLVVTAHPGKTDCKTVHYLFDGGKGVKFAIIANGVPETFEKMAPLVDAAMKTFVQE